MPKVAIMGAGLAGLCCAHRLLDHGITPEIFEVRHRVGERPSFLEAVVHMIHRPLTDSVLLLSQRYGISMVPASLLHTLRVHSPNNYVELRGNLGYTTIRGNDERSWERQLAGMVRGCRVHFNVDVASEDLQRDFDYVVVATGDPTIAMERGLWQTDQEVFIKGGQIEGKFNPGIVDMWLDTEMSRQWYVFRAAFDEHHANVNVIAAPSSNEELDGLWETTIAKLNLKPEREGIFKLEEWKIGRIKRQQDENLIFIGNAAGYQDVFLGFGQIPSMLSGIYAADYIAGKGELERPMHWFHKNYEYSRRLREYADQLDNAGFDRMLEALKAPYVRPLLFGTGINALGLFSSLVTARQLIPV